MKQKIILIAISILILLICGSASYYTGYAKGMNYNKDKIAMLEELLSLKEQKIELAKELNVVQNEKNTISYVKKESPNDVDIQIDDRGTKVIASYNDNIYKFDTLSSESSKFENGKLVINRTSEIKLDIREIVNEQLGILSNEIKKNERHKALNATRIGIGVGLTEKSQMVGAKFEKDRIEYMGFKKISGSGDNYFVGCMYNIPVK